ncbi:MAG TPA: thiamine pyrophosphate-binding protein, partial [Bacteroidales bacterium]|nr:thiamine pyrophosphate-binding protein [Bacteroidales bacterium]
MTKYYTEEKNAQIIISLLKKYGIKKVIASPGTTNMALVLSMQNDSFFEMYSSVDERSAAYIACGLSAESGEPVVLSCTGATASRNYVPGLTEAYYRKLPILAVTSMYDFSKVGHHIAQVIDRSSLQND